VRQLAQAGVHTLLAGRKHDRAVATAQALQSQGLPVEAIVLDVTDAATIAAAATEVERRHGRLDILVNHAGLPAAAAQVARRAQSISPANWHRWRGTRIRPRRSTDSPARRPTAPPRLR
jgi:NAD(P)-dependent dehydrogenase (short-subunit alcohol dehydrogenase family)